MLELVLTKALSNCMRTDCLKFNKCTCQVLDLGRNNPMENYRPGDVLLQSNPEGDLGVQAESH